MNSHKLSDMHVKLYYNEGATHYPRMGGNTGGRLITIILDELFEKTGIRIFYESEKDKELLEELYNKTGIKISREGGHVEGIGRYIKGINSISTELDNLLPEFYENLKKDKELEDRLNKLEKKPSKTATKKPRKTTIPKSVKNTLWNNTFPGVSKGKCYVCNRNVESDNFHTSHIISEKNGGTVQIGNLKVCCAPCNLSMGTENLEDFKKKHYG